MAGHNKWSKVKRIKAVVDAKRSKVWQRIAREMMVAAREHGGDAGMNPRLQAAIERAKAENMPKDNIQRAIKRGTGELAGSDYEELVYEGYAVGGIAVLVESLTDNPTRTVADVRHAFSKNGGNLGATGSVSYLFEHKGMIEVPANTMDEMELFELVADAGADDLVQNEDVFTVYTSVENFASVQKTLEEKGVKITEANLTYLPTTTLKVNLDEAKKILKTFDMLEELQDVQEIYSTLDLDDEMLDALG